MNQKIDPWAAEGVGDLSGEARQAESRSVVCVDLHPILEYILSRPLFYMKSLFLFFHSFWSWKRLRSPQLLVWSGGASSRMYPLALGDLIDVKIIFDELSRVISGDDDDY